MARCELLCPAGDWARMEMAVLYGADAVYLAGNDFGMRAFAGNFSSKQLASAVAFCHGHGVAVYVTCNTMPRNAEVDRLPEWLSQLEAAGVDAVIVADLGVFQMAGKYAPSLRRHVSTQAGVANYGAAAAWHDLGASRVILARELSLDEVLDIRTRTPKTLELEAFVHGAMCVSYSGRCVLSDYMTGRNAQRGACAQPCRYQYALVEEKRPGEYFPIFEESGETFILNSRDMCMIDHIPALLKGGLTSLKIEGRAKSAYYAAVTAAAYRHALDAAERGEPLDPIWRAEVEKVSHRHYSTGFWFGTPGQFTEDARYVRSHKVCAVVLDCRPDGMARLSLRNKFHTGEILELLGPGLTPAAFPVPVMEDLEGLPLTEPRNPQMEFWIRLPRYAPPLSMLRRQEIMEEQ